MDKGQVAFDTFKSDPARRADHGLWWKALKNLRADMMPPHKKPQPSLEQKALIAQWIKSSVFEADPKNPDPGRVTLRRLNRVEYANTIRDLVGVDFDAVNTFPPDDTGEGFDNIADVLTLSPMLLEKYLAAAEKIISQAVPTESKIMPEQVIARKKFRGDNSDSDRSNRRDGSLTLSFYSPAAVSNVFRVEHAGRYQLSVGLAVHEKFADNVADSNKCRLIFKVDGQERMRKEFTWQDRKPYHFKMEQDWSAGGHDLAFELTPLTPKEKQTRALKVQIRSVTVRGPMDQQYWVHPRNYTKFFPKEPPAEAKGRRAYANKLLTTFAEKAFRRPVDAKTADRLTTLAESIYTQPGKTFEAGVEQGMVAVLASPRFLFREEAIEPGGSDEPYPLVDEYALASRLSYFLWSSMPDQELFRLAREGKLRQNQSAQVARMLADPRSEELVRNFTGQWLEARDVESRPIEAQAVLALEEKPHPEAERQRRRFLELVKKSDASLTPAEKQEREELRAARRQRRQQPARAELTYEVRQDMREETEDYFNYVLREDRPLSELLASDYTFLNERLAKFYDIPGVTGDKMRRVTLPAGSPRGGILTQGTMLIVTSNPTRTSPVKRGVYILDNILGMPPAPPPPNLPPLEEAAKGLTNRNPSLRETLAAHRASPLCSSCHNRMDPLGLALENFNAMGMWRDTEHAQPIDASGQLITGESFTNVNEFKQILVQNHAKDFYRTLTEKLLTYALGRGLDYHDVETVDQIVARLEAAQGRPSALLAGIIESAPFQRTRRKNDTETSQPMRRPQQRAEARIKH